MRLRHVANQLVIEVDTDQLWVQDLLLSVLAEVV